MTPEERADDIMVRCWWDPQKHPGEQRPPFNGLDVAIAEIERTFSDGDRATKIIRRHMVDSSSLILELEAVANGMRIDANAVCGSDPELCRERCEYAEEIEKIIVKYKHKIPLT